MYHFLMELRSNISAPHPQSAWNGIVQMQVFYFSENWSWNIWKDAACLSWVSVHLLISALKVFKGFWRVGSDNHIFLLEAQEDWYDVIPFTMDLGNQAYIPPAYWVFFPLCVLSNEKSTKMLIMHSRGLPSLCSCKALCSHEQRTHEPAACSSWLEQLLQFPKALKFKSEITVIAIWGLWVVQEGGQSHDAHTDGDLCE